MYGFESVPCLRFALYDFRMLRGTPSGLPLHRGKRINTCTLSWPPAGLSISHGRGVSVSSCAGMGNRMASLLPMTLSGRPTGFAGDRGERGSDRGGGLYVAREASGWTTRRPTVTAVHTHPSSGVHFFATAYVRIMPASKSVKLNTGSKMPTLGLGA